MTRVKHRLTCLAVLAAVALPATVQAREARQAFMPAGPVADAPTGFVEMCQRDLVLCEAGNPAETVAQPIAAPVAGAAGVGNAVAADAVRFGTGAIVPAVASARKAVRSGSAGETDELKLLRALNAEVNRFTIQASDMEVAGTEEYWQRPAGQHPTGDCEDIAIEKRMRLVERGFDPARLFYVVAYRRGFGLHTVLVARLADGDYVLDSMSPWVLHWSDVHYSWLRQQTPGHPMEWRRIGGASVNAGEAVS